MRDTILKLHLILLAANTLTTLTKFSEEEENMLTDLLKHLKVRNCILVGGRIAFSPSILKKFSTLNIYTATEVDSQIFVPNFRNMFFEHKSVVVYKSAESVATINEYFSSLQKVISKMVKKT